MIFPRQPGKTSLYASTNSNCLGIFYVRNQKHKGPTCFSCSSEGLDAQSGIRARLENNVQRRALVVPGSNSGTVGPTHQLQRHQQTILFQLRAGHCRLLSHLHHLKISHTDECPCGTGPQTPEHILQQCPAHNTVQSLT